MTPPRGRVRGEDLAVRDAEMLRLADLGLKPAEIADRFGVSRQLVSRRLKLAKGARDEERGRPDGDAESAVEGEPEKKDDGPPLPWWLTLVPLFPIGPLTPTSKCPHHCRRCGGAGKVQATAEDATGKLARRPVECPSCRGVPRLNAGSLLCCMVCSRSGMDGHPALERDPKLDPAPEPPPRSPAPAAAGGKPKGPETRREKRAREFGPVA